MPERASPTSLAYTSRSTGGAREAEGNVPKTRDALESIMRGHNSPRPGSGRRGAWGETISQHRRRLPGHRSRRRAEKAEARGGRVLPVYD
jgi:hypothetical protein